MDTSTQTQQPISQTSFPEGQPIIVQEVSRIPQTLQPEIVSPESLKAPNPAPDAVVSALPHPEQAPIITKSEEAPVYLETSYPTPELSSEVRSAGVSSVSEEPVVTAEDRFAGVEPANEAVPVQLEPTGLVTLPMTAEKATEILKTDHNSTDARVWAANVVLYELHKKHLQEELAKNGGEHLG